MKVGLGRGPGVIPRGERRLGQEGRHPGEADRSHPGWGPLTSVRAGHEVVADIPRVFGIHMSRDGVKAQELVTPEAVVAADPSHGGGAVAHGRPEALLCGFCLGVPEPGVGACVQPAKKPLVRSGCTCLVLVPGPRMDRMRPGSHGAHSPAGRQLRRVVIPSSLAPKDTRSAQQGHWEEPGGTSWGRRSLK